MFSRLRSLLLAPFRRNSLSDSIDDEFALHIDLRTDDLIRSGLAPDEARRRARMEFGNLTTAKETARAGWGMTWVDRLERDFRYAIRTLRRNPGFTAVAVLSLGFGIGATTTAFSVIDALDFRPLPFADADRLVWLAEFTPPKHEICAHCSWLTSPPTARDWATQATSFEAVGAMTSTEVSLDHDDVTESLRGARVTPGFFGLLGVRPVFGREFVATDTAHGASGVAIISYEFWKTRLGASRDVLGTPLATGGNSPRPIIIGVLPEHFRFGSDRSVWLPLTMDGSSRANRWLTVVARLGPGQTIGRANVELKTIAERLAAAYPADYRGWDVRVESLRTLITMPAGKARFALFATTVLVLLIAVLNVAGLLLGRAVARRQELAMRSALGASSASLLHQMLVEGSCIGVGGGVLSVLLTQWFIRFVPRWFSVDTIGLSVDVNRRVFAFAAVVSIVVGVGAAALPAVRIAAMNVSGTLRGTADAGVQGSYISNALIALQIALGLVVLTTAALMSRDFLELRYLDLGYRPDSLYFTSISGVAGASRDPAAWGVVAEEVRSRVAAVPGVVSVSLEHQNAMHPRIVRPDGDAERRDTNVTPVVKAVDVNYFETFGTRLVSGRPFVAGDAPGAPLVAIINKAAADVFWPRRSPLGRRVFVGDSASGGEVLTVIGVAANAERGELFQRHWPMLYRPLRQGKIYHAAARLYVRAGDNPAVLAAAERAIRETTTRKAIPFASDEEKLNNGLMGRRAAATALDVFAAFGLLLAAMGIYGNVNYAAKRRAREIGIRMALGAKRWGVVGLVARRGVLLALAGSGAGVIGAIMLMRTFKASALTTTVATPWIFAGSVALMVVVVLVATLLPAARATRVDVVIALRAE